MTRYTSREFPPYRHEPGRTPHPERSPRGYRHRQEPEREQEQELEARKESLSESDWRRNDDYLYGVDLFNAGYFWEAHAIWEELWMKAEPGDTRTFLQSLIQLAAGCLKRSMGRSVGARKLFAAARSRLDRLAETSPAPTMIGIDLRALCSAAENPEGGSIQIVLRD